MIEKMKTVCIVSSESSKDKMLNSIRDIGVLHVSDRKPADSVLTDRFAELTKTRLFLMEIPGSSSTNEVLSDSDFESLDRDVCNSIERKKELSEDRNRCSIAVDKIKAWGDFKPEEISSLKDSGVELHFYKLGKKEFSLLEQDESTKFIRLASVDKMNTVAVVGNPLDSSFSASEFILPIQGLSELLSKIKYDDAEIAKCEKIFEKASKHIASYNSQIIKCKNQVNYSSVSRTSVSEDGLVWICGYIPVSEEKTFVQAASENKWAYFIQDVDDYDENVPTKVKYTKVTGLMEPVFGILGIVPGYNESDISLWFLGFFSLFFAMIIGDAGYGFCFLAVAVAINIKQKKLTNLTLLVYLMSVATIAWGCVTGTWFGLEQAMNVPFLKMLVLKPLANYPNAVGYDASMQQNNIMKFCFSIGTIHLSLACVLSIRKKISEHNLSWIADLGWLSSINALYYVVLYLVIGADVNLTFAVPFILLGFLLVVLFGGMGKGIPFIQGLKAGLGGAFTVFLNTISAFGNVMSYIRLFAVGMASLAIAQSFNNMAFGFNGFLKVFGIIVFIIGHSLNLVMGLLSVVVHGIRLNLLEFSGQLGMEWSGVAYEPFKTCIK